MTFLVVAEDGAHRDTQIADFSDAKYEKLNDLIFIDDDSLDWRDFSGQIVLGTYEDVDSKEDALKSASEDFDIPVDYLEAYQLA